MTSRYSERRIKQNKHKLYKQKLKSRGVKRIGHYVSPKFLAITEEEFDEIDFDIVYWSVGSKFYKLAQQYYDDPRLWWVIAYFNKKPTDFHAKIGDMIFIPKQWDIAYNAVVESDEQYE
mgnify:CR=1 FL=1|tara:strand:+ start:847 stop:1203 length:357 start_codon:yes stop_codon:yes gene_type:complete